MILTIAGEDYEVVYTEKLNDAVSAVAKDRPKYVTYDTETTGLHIKKDRPFMGAVCWDGKVFVFPTNRLTLMLLPEIAKRTNKIYAHNTTYDMHMTANGMGDDMFPLRIDNWGDTMCLARLTFEAVSTRDGGDSLKLKKIGSKYIDPDADKYERVVKKWLKDTKSSNIKILTGLVRSIMGGKGWTQERIKKMLKGEEEIPEQARSTFDAWNEEYPKPTYQDVPMDIMLPYLAVDVILTNLLVRMAAPIVIHKEQLGIMNEEFELIPVTYKMERAGIDCDREYLQESLVRMDAYIERQQTKMWALAGRKFTVGQHELIKGIYEEKLGYRPESTDKPFLLKQKDAGDELAGCINTLRRLEKWRETYIIRILEVSAYDGRFYSTMNPYNPISGRFSGDAQQFPKDAIYDEEENEVFFPRKAFKGRIYYLDYSQVELRMQAHYTLPFGGDLNLCRAYMPFKCYHYATGEWYNHADPAQRKRWIELREGAPIGKHWEDQLGEGWSVWINPDTTQPWTPTDVHGSTTTKALDIIKDMQGHDFKWWRNIGKRFNFMRNYGGGDAMAAEVLDIPIEYAKAMNKGYSDAFPLVITYQKAIEKQMRARGYVQNLYSRRYYGSNSRGFYKFGNYIIQGPCADMLKRKMIIIDKFITHYKLKMKMILCVHDELQFEVPTSEDWAIPYIKAIMEDVPEVSVPIVAEVEFTSTNWAVKKKVLEVEKLGRNVA